MITRIYDERQLFSALGEKHCLFSGKIWALYAAYGFNYDFCTFYVQENGAVIGSYYGKATVFCPDENNIKNTDADELSDFLRLPLFGELLMSEELCKRLRLQGAAVMNNIMRFADNAPRVVDITKEEVDYTPSLGKVYEILKDGFDIDHGMWYTDISHNLRHGISEVYTFGGATVTKMFTYGDISFLSFVASGSEARGTGAAKRLLRRVCLNEVEKGRSVYLICRDAVLGFYEKCGFERVGKAFGGAPRVRDREIER